MGKAPGKLTNRISKGQLDEDKAVTPRVTATAEGERKDLGPDAAGGQGLTDPEQRSASGSVLVSPPRQALSFLGASLAAVHKTMPSRVLGFCCLKGMACLQSKPLVSHL